MVRSPIHSGPTLAAICWPPLSDTALQVAECCGAGRKVVAPILLGWHGGMPTTWRLHAGCRHHPAIVGLGATLGIVSRTIVYDFAVQPLGRSRGVVFESLGPVSEDSFTKNIYSELASG